MAANAIGKNLRRLRRSKQLSQKKLSEKAGLSRPAYVNIERGKSKPGLETIESLADALGTTTVALLKEPRKLRGVRLRARKMKSCDSVLATVSARLDDYRDLQSELPEKCILSRKDDLPTEPEAAAVAMRQRFGLSPDTPIKSICELLTGAGFRVVPIEYQGREFNGLSLWDDDGRPVVAINTWDGHTVERWIFTGAHELGHLVLHRDQYGDGDDMGDSPYDQSSEGEADSFGGHFLMPRGAFRSKWDDLIGLSFVQRVLRLKAYFKVSYQTVLYRLYKERVGDYPDLMKRFSHEYGRPFRTYEEPYPLRATVDYRDEFERLVATAAKNGSITKSRGAEMLGMAEQEFRERIRQWNDTQAVGLRPD